MKYESAVTVQSKAMEGVTFTVRKVNVRRRLAFNASMAEYNDKLRKLHAERAPLDEEYRAAIEAAKASKEAIKFADDKLAKWSELRDQERLLDESEMTPALVRWGLVRIDGLEIDGAPATVDSLFDAGPDALYMEIAKAIARELGLLDEEKENLPSASTSGAVEDGSKSNSSAAPAETPITIQSATVGATTQTT